jgi:2-C-methyl-D-erythritol 2,4-cyclodiphosphate synthase
MIKKTIRIGCGFDVHRFNYVGEVTNSKPLTLMGCVIPYDRFLIGHSDADVMLHALMDAMLGAVGLGDIGHHFPDTDPLFLNANSIHLLEYVTKKIRNIGWDISNIDISLIGESPKISPYIKNMRDRVILVLGIDPSDINIKATTTERLGFTGRGEGLAAQAVVLLQKI